MGTPVDETAVGARVAGGAAIWAGGHPGVELRANLQSISHRCHLLEVAFVCELTKEVIQLPMGCLQVEAEPEFCTYQGSAERKFCIDSLLVRTHLVIETILVDRPCAMRVSITFSR